MQREQFMAVDGVCAWPSLTLLPDGTLLASIFNQPCHGSWEGDLDCWASTDGGRSWNFRGRIAEHETGTNRMNCAAGLAANGDVLVAVSGWDGRGPVGERRGHEGAHTLRAWVCRSNDGGANWTKVAELPETGTNFAYVPFGDIQKADDRALCLTAYHFQGTPNEYKTYFLRSYDDGFTWETPVLLNPEGNETAILNLGGGRWLAASRVETDRHIDLYVSEDDGRTWGRQQALTGEALVTGHLMRLRDGRVLLSYGNRRPGECGIEIRVSEDGGRSWSVPQQVADMPMWDGGYPSTVEREDGTMVTALYADHPEGGDHKYQMDVAIWKP